jgi:hypothetical protein
VLDEHVAKNERDRDRSPSGTGFWLDEPGLRIEVPLDPDNALRKVDVFPVEREQFTISESFRPPKSLSSRRRSACSYPRIADGL